MVPRGKKKVFYFILIIALICSSDASTPIITTALKEHKKDIANANAGEVLKHDSHKGENVKDIETSLSDKKSSDFSEVKDAGHYDDKDVKLKQVGESGSFEGHKLKTDGAEDQHSAGYRKGHKKGHHNQGFHNSYHKDESSNKSSFFDDFTDEGDQAVFNKKHNKYDIKDGRQYQGNSRLNDELVHNKQKSGGYDRHGGHENKAAGHHDYGKKHYVDDRQDYNKWKQGRNQYDRGQHYGKEASYVPTVQHGWGGGGHGYGHDIVGYHDGVPIDIGHGGHGGGHGWEFDRSDDRYDPITPAPPDFIEETRPAVAAAVDPGLPPVVAQRKQTITIYEDPRYDGTRRNDRADPQLEVRPSRQRYEYDDTYYVPARRDARGGVSRKSEVNQLVYNYRRQR